MDLTVQTVEQKVKKHEADAQLAKFDRATSRAVTTGRFRVACSDDETFMKLFLSYHSRR